MKDGFYKVEFHAAQGQGAGVVFLQSGKIYGGDSVAYFSGTFSEDGDVISADLTTGRHSRTAGIDMLFGRDKVSIALKGKRDGDRAHFSGTVKELPGSRLEAFLAPLPT